jgi:dTDP-4-dehydrorhamnose reductase
MIAISGAETPLGKTLLSALDDKKKFIKVDINPETEKGFFVDFFKTEKPSVFINLSQLQNIDEAEYCPDISYNLHSFRVRDSSETAAQFNCLYVLFSSVYIFNGNNLHPYTEEDIPEPVSSFGDSILLGENFLKKSGSKYLIFRSGELFGNGLDLSAQRFLKKDFTGKLKIIKDMKISPSYLPDVAQALLILINNNSSGIYNLCNSGSATAIEFINKAFSIIKETGNALLPEYLESDIMDMRFSADRPLLASLNCKKYIAETGKELRSWEDALRDYIIKNQIKEI